MSNIALFGFLTIIVLVNAYFAYRRSEDVLDSTGRKQLAATQLLYLVFIGFVFVVGGIVKATGMVKQNTGSTSWVPFILMVVFVIVMFAAFFFLKYKLEAKIRRDHSLEG